MKNQRQQQGFVLILTLLILIVVALAAGYFAERVAHSVELAEQSQQNTKAMIDMASARAEVLYRVATTSVTEYGLGRGNAVISLDNRPYRTTGGTQLQIQDDRGLLNLNIVDDDRLHRFLGMLGVPSDQRARLIDCLRDYIDADDLRRLNGAEKEEYLARNLPPPPNRILLSPGELKGIIGWMDAPQLVQKAAKLATTGSAIGLNPNTASAEILTTLPGVTNEMAQRIIAQRNIVPITSLPQLAEIAGIPTQPFEDGIAMLPSDSMRITQSAPGLAWSVQFNITLTPKGKDAPWQIDYYGRMSNIEQPSEEAAIRDLPPRSMAPPESQPL